MGDPGETRDRLEAIRKRAEEATPAPWYAFSSVGSSTFSVSRDKEHKKSVVHWMGFDCSDCTPRKKEANAAFIAASREDIPWLLGEVSRLRERVKELEAEKARQEEVSRGVRTCEGCGWKDDPDDEEGPKREMYCDDDGVYVCAECALTWDDELSPSVEGSPTVFGGSEPDAP